MHHRIPEIYAIDHFGIRVSDRRRSQAFYQRLGFSQIQDLPQFEANEMVNGQGIRINLIYNGARFKQGRNVLLDEPVKYPGFTHPAFVVPDLTAFKGWCEAQGIPITEDIHAIGRRRIALFIRDPDGNVLEFNQLLESHTEQSQ